MPIYFNSSTQELPLAIDSIGSGWTQEPISRPKGFPLYHWLQTESGLGAITLSGQDFLLHPGEGILIAPHTPHRYQNVTERWQTAFVTFGGALANDIHKICGESAFLFIHAEEGTYFQAWINHALPACQENTLDDWRLSVQCYEFFMHLSRFYQKQSQTEHPLYRQYIAPILKRIETDPAAVPSVSSLASEVHITSQYLTRLFHRFIGCSAQSYIARSRINKAKELLIISPYLKVQSISHMSGFHNVSYFISTFRQQTGITPKQFRKNYGIRET